MLSSVPWWAVRQPDLCRCHHTACGPKLCPHLALHASFRQDAIAATQVVARGSQVGFGYECKDHVTGSSSCIMWVAGA